MLAEDHQAARRRIGQDFRQRTRRSDLRDTAAFALLGRRPGDLFPALRLALLAVDEFDHRALARHRDEGPYAPLGGPFDDVVHGFVLEDGLDQSQAQASIAGTLALQDHEPGPAGGDGLHLRPDPGPFLIEKPDGLPGLDAGGPKMAKLGPVQQDLGPVRLRGRDEEQAGGQGPSRRSAGLDRRTVCSSSVSRLSPRSSASCFRSVFCSLERSAGVRTATRT